MKKYDEQNNLIEARCNKCGKNVRVENGIIKEGLFSTRYQWGYFSEKDGEVHEFDICEACYDEWIRLLQIQLKVDDAEELL